MMIFDLIKLFLTAGRDETMDQIVKARDAGMSIDEYQTAMQEIDKRDWEEFCGSSRN